MTTPNNHSENTLKAQKRRLDKRIESMGWALFLIWSGALLIAPDELVPEGLWLMGTGFIIIASMGIRYLYGIRIDGFWTVLGFLALGFGIGEFLRLDVPVFPLLLIIVGGIIAYNVFFRKTGRKRYFWKSCWDGRYFRDCCGKGENDEKA